MAQKKRRPSQRKRDLFTIAQLYLQRKTQKEIALTLGVSQQQIAYDLKGLQKQWAKERAELIDQKINEDLARVDAAEREYWQGWANSQRPREERTVDPDKGIIVKTITTAGDPRFLDGVTRCIDQRAALLGVLVKRKIGTTGDASPMTLPIKSITVTLPRDADIDAELDYGGGS